MLSFCTLSLFHNTIVTLHRILKERIGVVGIERENWCCGSLLWVLWWRGADFSNKRLAEWLFVLNVDLVQGCSLRWSFWKSFFRNDFRKIKSKTGWGYDKWLSENILTSQKSFSKSKFDFWKTFFKTCFKESFSKVNFAFHKIFFGGSFWISKIFFETTFYIINIHFEISISEVIFTSPRVIMIFWK